MRRRSLIEYLAGSDATEDALKMKDLGYTLTPVQMMAVMTITHLDDVVCSLLDDAPAGLAPENKMLEALEGMCSAIGEVFDLPKDMASVEDIEEAVN